MCSEPTVVSSTEAEADCIHISLDVTGDTGSVVAAFSQNGQIIRRCGSGSVAAAHVLLTTCHYPSGTVLQTSCERLVLQQRDHLFGYTGNSLPIEAAAPLPANLFNISPLRCFFAGGNQDYLIATFERADLIRALKPNASAICRATERAIIATAPADQPDVDFVLRYFAPQYGQREDNATGSANIILGHYWSALLHKPGLRSQQLSAAGGEFQLEITGSVIPKLHTSLPITLLAKSHLIRRQPKSRLLAE